MAATTSETILKYTVIGLTSTQKMSASLEKLALANASLARNVNKLSTTTKKGTLFLLRPIS